MYKLVRRYRHDLGLLTDLASGQSSGGKGKGRLPDALERVICELTSKRFLTRQRRSMVMLTALFAVQSTSDIWCSRLLKMTLGMDTHTPTGKLMLTVLGAQFEREMMLERQREGVPRAKAAGKYKGRKPIAPAQRAEVLQLAGLKLTKASIAQKLGLGEASVYRILAEAKNGKI